MTEKAYQRVKETVNATVDSIVSLVGLPLAGLVCAIAGFSDVSAAATVEAVEWTSRDGASVTADYYRPEAASAEAVVLFPDLREAGPNLHEFAVALQADGFHVLLPDLGLPLATGTPLDQERFAVRTGEASFEFLESRLGPLDAVVLAGVGRGASVVVRIAKRRPELVTSVLLLDPGHELLDVSFLGHSISAGEANRPYLVVVGREDRVSRDVARSLFLGRESQCRLWFLDGDGTGVGRMMAEEDFLRDLSGWTREAVSNVMSSTRLDRVELARPVPEEVEP